MAKNSKDWNEGYEAAIEAIKQALENGQNPSQSGGGMDGSNQGQKNNAKGDNEYQVTPEDCAGPSSLGDIPSTPGGMIGQDDGHDIADSEGYDAQNPGSDSAQEREWKEAALQAAQKMKGKLPGKLISKLEGLYKTTKDWKKELKKVVGHAISPEDKRQAFANKNILVSQDRIARTDKDKYNHTDYIMAWVDSSGSMSDDQLKMCLNEVYHVALAKKPMKLIVIQCDTKIQDIKVYNNLKELKKDAIHAEVKGRGGTELKPCWDLLETDPKYKKPADLIMVFTDGYLTQYRRNPKKMKNICWCILDNPGWNIEYKDSNTKVVYLNTADIK
jgi:predicted metal-dependent peptidase